jgi:mRNA interferase RelE/StbE
MVSYRVKIKSSAQKEIRKLPSKGLRVKVVDIIDSLYAASSFPEGSTKIKGSNNIYRIRQGTHRIVYQVYKKELLVLIIRVRHRRDVYKDL